MFDKSFDYRLATVKKSSKEDLIKIYVYSFKSTNRRYIVEVEEYAHNIYVVKFYPKEYRLSEHKFNFLVNDFEASKVIRTCANIMIDMLRQNPTASFGFIGANTITKDYTEQKYYTKRFSIYKTLMSSWFPEDKFLHSMNEANSAYLLINKDNDSYEELMKEAVKMFIRNYPDLDTE